MKVVLKLSCQQTIIEDSDNANDIEMEDSSVKSVNDDAVETEKVNSDEEEGHAQAEANYMLTKSLGDADCEVSYHLFCSAMRYTDRYCI